MKADAVETARTLVLTALCASAVAQAQAAWGRAFFPAVLFTVLAVPAGEALAPLLRRAGWAMQVRILLGGAWVGLAVLLLLALPVSPTPAVVGGGVDALSVAEVVALLASGLVGPVAVAGALLLAGLATLRGGGLALAAVLTTVPLLALLLALERAIVLRQRYPKAARLPVEVTVRRALGPLVPVMAVVWVLLTIWPPTVPERLRDASGRRELRVAEVAPAYRMLSVLAMLAGGGTYVIAWVLKRRGRRGGASTEILETALGGEEALPAEPARVRTAYPGTRGAIVRAYVGFLARASAQGVRRKASATPAEFAAGVRVAAASGPLGRLTALFMRARYGPDEPSTEDVQDAENTAAAATYALVGGVGGTIRRSPPALPPSAAAQS